jgi:hypothetical protein
MPAPRMPKHTCPMIDRLKGCIERAHARAADVPDEATAEELHSLLSDIAHELKGEAGALEDLRDANLGLRNCAEYWQEEAARLEAAVDA